MHAGGGSSTLKALGTEQTAENAHGYLLDWCAPAQRKPLAGAHARRPTLAREHANAHHARRQRARSRAASGKRRSHACNCVCVRDGLAVPSRQISVSLAPSAPKLSLRQRTPRWSSFPTSAKLVVATRPPPPSAGCMRVCGGGPSPTPLSDLIHRVF